MNEKRYYVGFFIVFYRLRDAMLLPERPWRLTWRRLMESTIPWEEWGKYVLIPEGNLGNDDDWVDPQLATK